MDIDAVVDSSAAGDSACVVQPRSSSESSSLPGIAAPPVQTKVKVPGWIPQTSVSPWSPISPDTVATSGKYKAPTTFGWIGQNDPGHIRWVLTYVDIVSDPLLVQMGMYFRERYQPYPAEPATELVTEFVAEPSGQEATKKPNSALLHPLPEVSEMLQHFRTIIAEMQGVLVQMRAMQARP